MGKRKKCKKEWGQIGGREGKEMGKRQKWKKEGERIGGREGKEGMNESKYFRLDDGRMEKFK